MGEYLFPVRKLTNKFSSISSKEDLQNFVQERSAHVTQTTLYGYLKTRIGTRYAIMVEDEKFSNSITGNIILTYNLCIFLFVEKLALNFFYLYHSISTYILYVQS